MTQDRKILSQTALSATTLTDCYTVPAGQKACLESITMCNRSTSSTFRVSVALFNDTVDSVKQYIYYDATLPATTDGSLDLYKTVWLKAGDIVRVYTASSATSVTLNGFEYHE